MKKRPPPLTHEQVSQQLEAMMPSAEFMRPAWCSAFFVAAEQKNFLQQFKEDTGIAYRPPRSPIEEMIDEATGNQQHFVLEFAKWFNKNVWGEANGRACNGDEPEELPPGGIVEGES